MPRFRFNDIDLATKSKSSLEHRQREEARIRKEANEKWETKVSGRDVTSQLSELGVLIIDADVYF